MSEDTLPKLKLLNSLTKKKEVFQTNNNNTINWYICGPTVYDSPHIGHARTYISFDAIRRILEGYFGYEVNYVMNITDVDDKIINKAKEGDVTDFKESCKKITQKYEKEFFDDLKILNVTPPTFLTRVTEYIEEIENFIKQLIKKELAYESNGSIYFDVQNYKKSFEYPLFVDKSAIKNEEDEAEPVSNVESLITPHETKLSKLNITPEKKNIADFALWKKRETELFYKCEIGSGRPGWHIECSAMACNIFPDGLDIHSGGIDLTFPHHENEIAQSQGLLGKKWVNYFLHTGHLHIDGLKMSKSLKNFITIKEFTKKYTPRQIRMLFLRNKWWMPMTYSEDSIKDASSLENKLFTFLSVLKSHIQENKDKYYINNVCFDDNDKYFDDLLKQTKNEIHAAFCDNIDTSLVLIHLFNFIQKCNQQFEKLSKPIMKVIYDYIYKLVTILGFIDEEIKYENNDEELLNIISEFRSDVRNICKKKGEYSEFYTATDKLRDNLKACGYIIEDKNETSRIRKI